MLAILKGETAETGITLDERQNGETNPISHNQLAINGLRLGAGQATAKGDAPGGSSEPGMRRERLQMVVALRGLSSRLAVHG